MQSLRETEPVPLWKDPDGVIRVIGCRVTLDIIVEAFQEGASPEEIAIQYPSLHLADVYAVLAYYLRHQEELDDYLQKRHTQAAKIRRQNESKFPSAGIRERLLARSVDKQT